MADRHYHCHDCGHGYGFAMDTGVQVLCQGVRTSVAERLYVDCSAFLTTRRHGATADISPHTVLLPEMDWSDNDSLCLRSCVAAWQKDYAEAQY